MKVFKNKTAPTRKSEGLAIITAQIWSNKEFFPG